MPKNLKKILRSKKVSLLAVSILILLSILIIYLSYQPAESFGKRITVTIFSPFIKLSNATKNTVFSIKDWFVTTKQLQEENETLKTANDILHLRLQKLEEEYGRLKRSSEFLEDFTPQKDEYLPAEVIGRSPNNWVKSIIINKGSKDGIQPAMPVIIAQGVIGIIETVAPDSSVVLLLYDPQVKIGAIIEKDGTQGIIEGTGNPDYYEMLLENQTVEIEPNTRVITSGFEGGIFPKGYTIGYVRSMRRREDGALIAIVSPSFSFAKLEEVLVIIGKSSETKANLSN